MRFNGFSSFWLVFTCLCRSFSYSECSWIWPVVSLLLLVRVSSS